MWGLLQLPLGREIQGLFDSWNMAGSFEFLLRLAIAWALKAVIL